MDKRFWICGFTVFATALALGFIVHGLLLRADYLALAHLFRSQADANAQVGWILLAVCGALLLKFFPVRTPQPVS